MIAWRCVYDHADWKSPAHKVALAKVNGGTWNGPLYRLDPWRQWGRERFPRASEGLVYGCDDGFVKDHDPNDRYDIGVWAALEYKRARRPQWPHKDEQILRALHARDGRMQWPLIIVGNGDVPTELEHWPEPCPTCGAPGPPPVPSTRMWVTKVGSKRNRTEEVDPARLCQQIFEHLQRKEEK